MMFENKSFKVMLICLQNVWPSKKRNKKLKYNLS
jgi:hypothetical protein